MFEVSYYSEKVTTAVIPSVKVKVENCSAVFSKFGVSYYLLGLWLNTHVNVIPVAWTCTTLLLCLSWGGGWLTGWVTRWLVDWLAALSSLVEFPMTAALEYVALFSSPCICWSLAGVVGWFSFSADKQRVIWGCGVYHKHAMEILGLAIMTHYFSKKSI